MPVHASLVQNQQRITLPGRKMQQGTFIGNMARLYTKNKEGEKEKVEEGNTNFSMDTWHK
jgi:hypothetical protein